MEELEEMLHKDRIRKATRLDDVNSELLKCDVLHLISDF